MASASMPVTVTPSPRPAPAASTLRSKRQQQRRAATVRPPADLGNGLEASVHLCSKAMSTELQLVIPEKAELIRTSGKRDQPPLVAVTTAQHTISDLAEWGADAAKEKDDCLERFAAWAAIVCSRITEKGYWADFIDPCSGHPMLSSGRGAVFSEVDSFQTLLGYTVTNAGGCRIVLHPKWGAKFYPATMFAVAPADVVAEQMLAAADAAAIPELWLGLEDDRETEPIKAAPEATAVALS